MFDYIGEKIKGLTVFICWAGIIASVISGVSMIANELLLSGLITAAVGSLVSWVGSFVLYGFGELVESAMEIRAMMNRTDGSIIRKGTIQNDVSDTWCCTKCGTKNTNVSSQCKGCGQYRS